MLDAAHALLAGINPGPKPRFWQFRRRAEWTRLAHARSVIEELIRAMERLAR